MEPWQREHITKNIDVLINNTICHANFLAKLQVDGILGDADVESINVLNGKHDKSKRLYDIVQTRVNGYASMMEALQDTCQSGSLNVLLEGFAIFAISGLIIPHHGRITDLFTEGQLKIMQTNIKSQITVKECVDFLRKYKTGNEVLNLVNDTIPLPPPYYIPRSLIERTQLHPSAFNIVCHDVFVLKGLERAHLTKLAKPNRTGTSSNQIKKITVRFIQLENQDHWVELRESCKTPIHLAAYQDGRYFIEETCGGVKNIWNSLGPCLKNGQPILSSEHEFINKIQCEGTKGICICDSPGMGKTMVLANIARKIAEQNPKDVIAFISLASFTASSENLMSSLATVNTVTKLIYESISPSTVTQKILSALVAEKKVKLQLFFDGFDEVSKQDLSWTKAFLSQASSAITNTRIFVTSRAHVRRELEEVLGVIGYDISPFTEANQIDFLSEFWQNQIKDSIKENLVTFAKTCLDVFKMNLKGSEKNITGIPLQCRLLGEVFQKRAVKYSRGHIESLNEEKQNFVCSVFDIYKRFIDLRFSEYLFKSGSVPPPTTDPLNDFNITKQAIEAISGESVCISELQQVKNFHLCKAIEVVFPHSSLKIYLPRFLNGETCSLVSEYDRYGILETTRNDNGQSIEFNHRTIAEYFASEFFAKLCCGYYTYKEDSNFLASRYCSFLINQILDTHCHVYIGRYVPFEQLELRYPPVAYFINAQLCIQDRCNHNLKIADYINSKMAPPLNAENMFGILRLCLQENYFYLFCFIKELIVIASKQDEVLKNYFVESQTKWFLFAFASRSENNHILEELLSLYRETFSVDICTSATRNLSSELVSGNGVAGTVLFMAVSNLNYEMLESLIDTVPTDNQDLLRTCTRCSYTDPPEMLKKRVDILKLLLSHNKNLLNEKLNCSSPLFVEHVHLELIKILIEAGADYNVSTFSGDTIAHTTAKYMSSEDYHELTRFLIRSNAADLFITKNFFGQTPLHVLLNWGKINTDTVKLVIDKTWAVIEEEDENANNLVHLAVVNGESWNEINNLINLGADYRKVNMKGQNVLHLAVQSFNVDVIPHFIKLGINASHRHNQSKYPLDYIIKRENDCLFMNLNNEIIKLFR